MSQEQMPIEKSEGVHAPEMQDLSSIAAAQSFEELYAALDELGAIQGSKHSYTAEGLKSDIENVRRVGAPSPILLSEITRTGGLRNKVTELIVKEAAAKE